MKTNKMKTNKMKTILSAISIALIAILPHAAQASTITIAANGATVTGVGNSRFFTSSLTSQVLDFGDQIRVGFFSSSSSLSTVVNNWNSGSYANASALSTALNAIFTPIGETGSPGTASGGKVTINDKQNLTTLDGAISFNITALDPVATGFGGKQIYLWATDDATWSNATALAIVTDATWTVPAANTTNLTVNTAYINLASSAELIFGESGPMVSGVNSIVLIPEPSSASLLALGMAGLVALRARRKS